MSLPTLASSLPIPLHPRQRLRPGSLLSDSPSFATLLEDMQLATATTVTESTPTGLGRGVGTTERPLLPTSLAAVALSSAIQPHREGPLEPTYPIEEEGTVSLPNDHPPPASSAPSKRGRPRKGLYLRKPDDHPPFLQSGDVLCSALEYTLTSNDNAFYLHPLGYDCLAVDKPYALPQADASRQQSTAFYANRRPTGPCLHCGRTFTHDRFFQARSQNALTGAYVVWGNFHSFACALGYAAERGEPNQTFFYTQKMAADLFGYTEPIRAAPPSYCLQSYGGHVPVDEIDEAAATSSVVIHQAPFISFAMMIECQDVDEMGRIRANAHKKKLDNALRWNVHGIRAPDMPGLFAPNPQPLPPTPGAPSTSAGLPRRHLVALQPQPNSAASAGPEEKEPCMFDEYVRSRASPQEQEGGVDGASPLRDESVSAPERGTTAAEPNPEDARARAPKAKRKRSKEEDAKKPKRKRKRQEKAVAAAPVAVDAPVIAPITAPPPNATGETSVAQPAVAPQPAEAGRQQAAPSSTVSKWVTLARARKKASNG